MVVQQQLSCILFTCTIGFTLLQLATNVAGDHDRPYIDSKEVIKKVLIGQTVVLTCKVEDPESHDVQWWLLNHGVQISRNTEILTQNNNDHYKILTVEGGEYRQWNLRISEVRANDSGLYKCRIDQTPESIVDEIIVEDGNVVTIPTDFDRVDFTDCCMKLNVSRACLPACRPETLDLETFNQLHCANDLLKLLECGADGRNHMPCCRRRLLPNKCLIYCANSPPPTIPADHQVCLDKAKDIVACFEEGHHLLPKPPGSLTSQALSAHSLYMKWEPPVDRTGNLTGYRVFYREERWKTYRSTDLVKETHHTVLGLNASKTYDVYVASIGVHGSSQPSYIVRVKTLPVDSFIPDSNSSSYTDCCERQGVSEPCRQALCMGRGTQGSGQNVAQCFTDMDKVFRCIALERNHTGCCQARDLPSSCLRFCQGQILHPSLSSVSCLTDHMPDIISCFDEGRGTIPGPPSEVVLSSVSNTSAVISWDPPRSNPAKVESYLVTYKQGFIGPTRWIPTVATSVKLTQLNASSYYMVKVASVNSVGSSLPSTDIVFLTYAANGHAWHKDPPKFNTSAIKNLTECCQEEGVKDECSFLCASYSGVTRLSVDTALACEGDLGKILMCGAGGRNHTTCCQEREVPSVCYAFCAFDRHTKETFALDYGHIPCVFQSSAITQCMQEGIAQIPSYPEGVTVVNYTAHTISLAWKKPRNIPLSGLKSYIVRYQLVSEPLGQWNVVILNVTQESYIIQNLQPDKGYRLQVLAGSESGYSLAENMVYSVTLPVKQMPPALLPNLNFTSPGDVRACCSREGVTTECLPACDGNTAVHIQHSCANQLDKLLKCSADGRDHRPCCQRTQVPDECLDFCMGNVHVGHFVSMICLSFSQMILTCYKEGFATLPSEPQNFHVIDIAVDQVKFGWNQPRVNGEAVTYDLYFKNKIDKAALKKDNVTSPYALGGLQPFTSYQVFVVSENKHGSSRPSAIIEIMTLSRDMPTINVWQIPEGNLKEHDSVSLTCDAGPNIDIYWVNNKGIEEHSAILHIEDINKSHTGRYTCIAEGGNDNRVAKDLYLHVVYAPEAKALKPVVSVMPNRGLTAQLRCEFAGFPEHVTWQKGSTEITPVFSEAYRFQRRLWTREEDGIIETMLEIQAVQPQDYGTYSCKGRNEIGQHDAYIHLINPNPVAVPPTITSPARPINVTKCCVDSGVTSVCLPACTFDVDLSIIEKLPNAFICLDDLQHLIRCASDGRNHTKCCRREGVPWICNEFCAGNTPTLAEEHTECLNHIDVIVTCMEEGADIIPTAPQNVKGQITSEGFIKLWWEAPVKNARIVQTYRVFFRSDTDGTSYMEVLRSEKSVVLNSLKSNTKYELYVTAHNHHGSSQKSNVITLSTPNFTPSNPQHLRYTLISYVNVRLAWDVPARHAGGVLKYRIHYRAQGTAVWKNETTSSNRNTYRLMNLQPKTVYEVYVTAQASTHESDRSNVILVHITSPPHHADGRQMSERNGNGVAVGVGVAFAVIILIALIAIIAVCFCRLKKSSAEQSEFKESVSFENPGYATPNEGRVGLPTFQQDLQPSANGKQPVPDGPYGYKEPAIMKEAEANSDQGYSTMSSSSTEAPPVHGQPQSRATLDVTPLNPVDEANVEQVSIGM